MSEITEKRRSFVIGDIHGCATALNRLIDQLDLVEDDRVIILGDAVDRGPDSYQVLETLIELQQTCELIYIMGNHEEMMLAAIDGRGVEEWLRHGGVATLESYGGQFQDIPDSHLDLLDSTVRYWEGPNEICIHANLEPGVELRRQRSNWLRWNKLSGREFPHPSGKLVICGHSGIMGGVPQYRNGWLCLDTLVYGGGTLSALDLVTQEILQSRENGEFRRGVYLKEIEF